MHLFVKSGGRERGLVGRFTNSSLHSNGHWGSLGSGRTYILYEWNIFGAPPTTAATAAAILVGRGQASFDVLVGV